MRMKRMRMRTARVIMRRRRTKMSTWQTISTRRITTIRTNWSARIARLYVRYEKLQ